MSPDRLAALHLMNEAARPDVRYSDEFIERLYGPALDALLDHPDLYRKLREERTSGR